MRARLVRGVNYLLAPLRVQITRTNAMIAAAPFDMRSAVRRIAARGIPIKTVIDIGAAQGHWSADALTIFPKASFLAIEPLRERQPALETLKRNHANFDYALCVAGETDGGQAILNVADSLDGSTVDGIGGVRRSVPVGTVDALVATKALAGPFLLKLDTHGYELPILAGAADTLTKTDVVIMEVYNFKVTERALRFHEMCAHLERIGFRCCDIAGPMLRPRDKVLWQMDLLFTRRDAAIFAHEGYR